MTLRLRASAPLGLLLALVAAAAAQSTRPAGPDPASWAPADALLYTGVSDINDVWGGIRQSASYALLSDPTVVATDPTLGLLVAAVPQAQARLAAALGVPLDELRNPLAGPLAFYLAASHGEPTGKLEGVLVTGVGDAGLTRQYIELALARLARTGRHDTRVLHGQEIHVVTTAVATQPSAPAAAEESLFEEDDTGAADSLLDELLNDWLAPERFGGNLAICLTSSRLIVARSPEAVEAALQRSDAESLAAAPTYRALCENLAPAGPVRFVVNVPAFVARRQAQTTGDRAAAEALRHNLDVLGADCVTGLVGHLTIGGTHEMRLSALLLTGPQRSGLVRLLSLDNAALAPAASVSADTVAHMRLGIDLGRLMDDVEGLLRRVNAQQADEFRARLEHLPLLAPEPVNLRRELLAHLTGPITMTVEIVNSGAAVTLRPLLAIGHNDRDALTQFLTAHAPLLTPRSEGDTTIFDMTLPPPVGPLAVAVLPDRLLLGTPAAVTAAVAGPPATPLTATQTWWRLAADAPQEAWGVVYLDAGRLYAGALDFAAHREEVLMRGVPDAGTQFLAALAAEVRSEDATEARKLLRYVSPVLMTLATTPEGLRLTRVDLKPEPEPASTGGP